ncbi:hypothetical protein NQ314_008835 [Rhamnusium bicolor]|uniref:Uncharacterized protein n=1 Tax=Rhamnusium bicolor TaxID=1586634 RepID=A0AAV8Y7W9_9CUCU|nr:hypothetical protein NQ314_008835 [Rhamnusium bicolor]
MRSFPSITKDSPSALRNLIDSVQKDLRTLESMKEPVKQWSTLLIFLICTKLDSGDERMGIFQHKGRYCRFRQFNENRKTNVSNSRNKGVK